MNNILLKDVILQTIDDIKTDVDRQHLINQLEEALERTYPQKEINE